MSESLSIKLDGGSKSIVKFGLLVRAFFVLFFVISTALFAISCLKESLILALICFAVAFVLFLVFFRILSAAFFQEQLIVTKEDIKVIHKNLSSSKEYVFRLDEVKYFGFADQHYTKHPMDNPVVDFTGLATQERELQYIIDEGNIRIETGEKNIKFGKNMPSWDVEELVEKIEAFTGHRFSRPKPGKPVGHLSVETEIDPDAEFEAETEASENIESEINADSETKSEADESPGTRYAYSGDFGELIIEQKKDIPGADDKAFLNGSVAPTGKYQVGEKQFVLVSNGIVYAVRGF